MKKPQEGFSAVEALLIVIIVGMLGGVGWYVWNSQKQVDKTYSQTANSTVAPKQASAKSSPAASQSNYLTIKEWGVRAKNSYGITPVYKIFEGGAYVSSQELVNTDPKNCYVSSGAGGAISRAKGESEYETPNGTSTGNTVEKEAKTGGLIKSYVKLGDYYYWYNRSQFNCLPSKESPTVQEKTVDAYEAMTPRLEAVPAQ
jgi:hypothetical protein